MRLRISPHLRSQLAGWAHAGYPEEVCGLLIGKPNGTEVEVEHVTRAQNLANERRRDRFELDPEHLHAADLEARAAGFEVIGVWHTHPDHPARPSETDRARAWENWSYLILSVARAGVGDLKSWRLEGHDFILEELLP